MSSTKEELRRRILDLVHEYHHIFALQPFSEGAPA